MCLPRLVLSGSENTEWQPDANVWNLLIQEWRLFMFGPSLCKRRWENADALKNGIEMQCHKVANLRLQPNYPYETHKAQKSEKHDSVLKYLQWFSFPKLTSMPCSWKKDVQGSVQTQVCIQSQQRIHIYILQGSIQAPFFTSSVWWCTSKGETGWSSCFPNLWVHNTSHARL